MSRLIRYAVVINVLLSALTACQFAGTGLTALAPTPSSYPTTSAYTEYIVQPGDTLGAIASRFHIGVQELVALNSDRYPTLATNPGLVRVGWRLRVPVASAQAQPTASADSTPSASDVQHADLNETAQLIIEGINFARAAQGFSSLRSDPTLTQIASLRSLDMIDRDYFSHNDPQTGQEELLRYLQQDKFGYQYAGENIAELKNDAGWVPPLLTVAARYSASDLEDEFVRGWLNSPEHRANILNGHYRRTGVALAFSRDGRRIVATQIFSD